MIKHALIMAAGRGTRMMPLTNKVPKAMAPYKGSTLIGDGIDKIKMAIPNIYITVGYKKAMLATHVIERDVTAVFNTEGEDNAWWIFNTLLRNINEPIFVLTCDNVVELDFAVLSQEYFSLGAPACMVVPVKPVPGLEGDYIHHEGNLIYKLSRYEPAPTYCSGIQILNPAKINSLINPADNFYQVWESLIEVKQLYSSTTYPDKWFAVDTMKQLNYLSYANSTSLIDENRVV